MVDCLLHFHFTTDVGNWKTDARFSSWHVKYLFYKFGQKSVSGQSTWHIPNLHVLLWGVHKKNMLEKGIRETNH